eukprot:206646-Alexandrium_andersonii.AAC.1
MPMPPSPWWTSSRLTSSIMPVSLPPPPVPRPGASALRAAPGVRMAGVGTARAVCRRGALSAGTLSLHATAL